MANRVGGYGVVALIAALSISGCSGATNPFDQASPLAADATEALELVIDACSRLPIAVLEPGSREQFAGLARETSQAAFLDPRWRTLADAAQDAVVTNERAAAGIKSNGETYLLQADRALWTITIECRTARTLAGN